MDQHKQVKLQQLFLTQEVPPNLKAFSDSRCDHPYESISMKDIKFYLSFSFVYFWYFWLIDCWPRPRSKHWNWSWSLDNFSFWRICAHSMRTGSSSTDIAELLTTFASHSWATFCSFDPIITLRTLFKLSALDELNEIGIIFAESVVNFVLSTGHSSVI